MQKNRICQLILLVLTVSCLIVPSNALNQEPLRKNGSSIYSQKQRLRQMTEDQLLELKEVWAVTTGAHVSFSNFAQGADISHVHYQLDHNNGIGNGWSAKNNQLGEWIQVSQEYPKFWTAVIMQGRGDSDQWVKTVKISYTLNGKTWLNVDDGKIFEANTDRNQKVRINFKEPVYARALRIYPQSWNNHMSLRFDAIYVDLE